MIDFKELPTLKGDRVRLRAMRAADAGALFEIFSDKEVARYWSSPPWTDSAKADELLESVRRGLDTKTLLQWGVCAAPEEKVVGTCTLWQIDAENQRAEIGFALSRKVWGRGLMIDALTLLLDFSFNELGLRRMEADVDPENVASIGLLERLGFQREGYLRERWCVGGKVTDSVILGLLGREWQTDGRISRPSKA